MIGKIFVERTDNIRIQFFRYILVGGMAFIIDFSVLFILTDIFDIHYLISAALAFFLGLATNYFLCIIWVFDKRRLQNKSFEFGIFALTGVIGLVLNELFIWFFTEHIEFHYLISKLCSSGFILLWNFSARKFLLFR